MEIAHLHVFLAVLESSSVTRGAERVGLSPGAVSQQLHTLSAGLGVELFVRAGKNIVATPAALRLAEHARLILRQVRLAEEEFENSPAHDTRPFQFATGPTTLIYRLGRPLRLLRRRFPRTEIHVTVAPTEEIVDGLLTRRFDLGLISMPVPEDRLTLLPLYEEELLGLRASPVRTGRSKIGVIPAVELADVPFILYPTRSNMRLMIEAFFQRIGIRPPVAMEADDTEALKRLVESGFGYSILPEFALRRQSRFLQLFRVAGHRLSRHQALAMPRTPYPRALTDSIARSIQSALMSRR